MIRVRSVHENGTLTRDSGPYQKRLRRAAHASPPLPPHLVQVFRQTLKPTKRALTRNPGLLDVQPPGLWEMNSCSSGSRVPCILSWQPQDTKMLIIWENVIFKVISDQPAIGEPSIVTRVSFMFDVEVQLHANIQSFQEDSIIILSFKNEKTWCRQSDVLMLGFLSEVAQLCSSCINYKLYFLKQQGKPSI